MTDRDLSAEIVGVLTTGEHTMLAIARTVKARNQDVIDHVRVLEAAGRVYQAEGPDGRIVYGLTPAATGTRGNTLTDADRLLAVLSDGQPHNHLSLYQLGMIVHSRVADLRKRGHAIRCWQESHPNGRRHWYQLLSPLSGAEEGTSRPASVPLSGDAQRLTTRGGASSPVAHETSRRLACHESSPGRAPATGRDQLSLLGSEAA